MSSNRWQAPQKGPNSNNGPMEGHYGPTRSDNIGGKRSRDDGDQYEENKFVLAVFIGYSEDEDEVMVWS